MATTKLALQQANMQLAKDNLALREMLSQRDTELKFLREQYNVVCNAARRAIAGNTSERRKQMDEAKRIAAATGSVVKVGS